MIKKYKIYSSNEANRDACFLEMIEIEGNAIVYEPSFTNFNSPELHSYYLSKSPVTNKLYALFLSEIGESDEKIKAEWVNFKGTRGATLCGIEKVNNSQFRAKRGMENHPMIYVSWYGAMAFCDWLSFELDGDFRLPLEKEWEFAAKGGIEETVHVFSGGNNFKEIGWSNQNSNSELKPIGLKLKNSLGLEDMSGNIWEWCGNTLNDNSSNFSDATQSWLNEIDDSQRILKGGSWDDDTDNCTISSRLVSRASFKGSRFGFRVAKY